MSLERVEIRNFRCFNDESPLIVPLDAAVVAFVGPNNAGKTAALKAFYELRPLWQFCEPQSFIQVYGKNSGVGAFLGVNDQSKVFAHGNSRPLSLDWVFSRPDKNQDPASVVQRIRVEVDQTSRIFQSTITLGNGEIIPANATLKWDADGESFAWDNGRPAATARGLAAASQRFSQARLVPAIRTMLSTASGNIYEAPQGASLASQWAELKTGHAVRGNQHAVLVERTLERLFGFERLQINVSPQGNELSITIGHHTYRLDEIGNGFSHLFYVAVDAIVRPTKLLLVDEPETGLHPTMQRELLSFLVQQSGGFLYFATHSVGLARAVADAVIGIQRQGGKLTVEPIQKLKNYAEWLGELSFSTWTDVGFAALLLVEGPTELRAIPHLLRLLGIDVHVMPQSLGGSDYINGSSATALGEYRRLDRPVYVLIDSERTRENQALPADRQTFIQNCEAFGYVSHALVRRAFENYLTEQAIWEVARGQSRALDHFEQLKGEGPGWSKFMVPTIVSKMQLQDVEQTDLGQFLLQIKHAVENAGQQGARS